MTLPQEFTTYTRAIFGPERWTRFVAALDKPATVSVRLNPFKVKMLRDEDVDALTSSPLNILTSSSLNTSISPVPWCRDAYWLAERPQFTLDPLLHAGAYYVQEAGSMFLDRVLRQHVTRPVLMLDLCAAPGGKSTLARAALPEGSLLVSNEPDRRRANILVENLQKQGHPGVIVTSDYAEAFSRTRLAFDVVLADVPCSGEGLFRRDEAAVGEWSVAAVRRSAELQRHIVSTIWPRLKPGGLLIYSTCTFNLHEDEENVRFIIDELGGEALSVDTDTAWHITGSLLSGFTAPVYRFIPGTTRSEGLFIAVIRKCVAEQCVTSAADRRSVLSVISPTQGSKATASYTEKTTPDKAACLKLCTKSLHTLYDGTPQPQQKGRDIIPAHAEALSLLLDRSRYPTVELTRDEALTYLRRETITLPPATPRGYVIVTFKNIPLGFVKNLGTRANNLYPREMAVRMQRR